MLKPYDVEINGMQTTLMLSDEQAKERGLFKAEPKPKAAEPAAKAKTPANKSRSAADKK